MRIPHKGDGLMWRVHELFSSQHKDSSPEAGAARTRKTALEKDLIVMYYIMIYINRCGFYDIIQYSPWAIYLFDDIKRGILCCLDIEDGKNLSLVCMTWSMHGRGTVQDGKICEEEEPDEQKLSNFPLFFTELKMNEKSSMKKWRVGRLMDIIEFLRLKYCIRKLPPFLFLLLHSRPDTHATFINISKDRILVQISFFNVSMTHVVPTTILRGMPGHLVWYDRYTRYKVSYSTAQKNVHWWQRKA